METEGYTEIATTDADYGGPLQTTAVNVEVTRGMNNIAEAVALGALSIFGAVGNCLTILAVFTDRQLRSQTSSFLIVNLAVADMVVFVIIEPFLAFSAATQIWPFSISLCAALGALVLQHIVVSVCGMTAIAVNRYYSVVRSKSYRRLFTRRRTLMLCLATWLLGPALILPLVITPFVATYSSYYGICIIASLDNRLGRAMSLLTGLTILASIAISSLCYMQIYRTVRESRRRVQPARPTGDDGGDHLAENRPPSPGSDENIIPARKVMAKLPSSRVDIAISLNLFIVFTVFCVCWIPLTVLIFVQNVAGVDPDQPELIPRWAWKTAYKMVLFNSTLNVFIYAWRNRNFRSAYAKLLKCQRR